MLDRIVSIVEKALLGNRNLSYPLFAATGGAAATVITTNAMNFTVKGRTYTKTATAAIPLTGVSQAAGGVVRYYLMYITAGGTIACMQSSGAEIPTIQEVIAAGIDPLAVVFFGVMKMTNSSVGAFIPGTTLLNVANLTQAYADLSCLPENAAAVGL